MRLKTRIIAIRCTEREYALLQSAAEAAGDEPVGPYMRAIALSAALAQLDQPSMALEESAP